jgi:hypothetical protein
MLDEKALVDQIIRTVHEIDVLEKEKIALDAKKIALDMQINDLRSSLPVINDLRSSLLVKGSTESRFDKVGTADEFDPKSMTKSGDGEDQKAEKKFLEQFYDTGDDRFGSSNMDEETALRLAFRAGTSWAGFKATEK